MSKTIDLGAVSAYALAVKYGYKGTEEEWVKDIEKNRLFVEDLKNDVENIVSGFGDVAEQEKQEIVDLTDTQLSKITTEGERVLQTIPQDYQTTLQDVEELKKELIYVNKDGRMTPADVSRLEDGLYYFVQPVQRMNGQISMHGLTNIQGDYVNNYDYGHYFSDFDGTKFTDYGSIDGFGKEEADKIIGELQEENSRIFKSIDEISETTKNLFAKTSALIGYRLSDKSLPFVDANCFLSDFIPVEEGKYYTKNSPIVDSYHAISTYDTNKNPIARYTKSNTLLVPKGCLFVRLCGYISELDELQLEEGMKTTKYSNHLTAVDTVCREYVYDIRDSLSSESMTESDEVSVEEADGFNTIFSFSNPIQTPQAISVYKNGLKMFNNKDYICYFEHKFIKFLNPPQVGDAVGYHYHTKWTAHDSVINLSDCINDDYKTLNREYIEYLSNPQFNDFGFGNGQWMENALDPTDAGKRVLAFNANACTTKVRCQLGTMNMNADELEAYVDVYFPSSSLMCLESYGEFSWFTVQEYWCPFGANETSDEKIGFRASINIGKKNNQSHLFFLIDCQDKVIKNNDIQFETTSLLDDRKNQLFPIPYDRWITLHTRYKVGSKGNGKIFFEVINNENTLTIFDENIQTQPSLDKILDYPNTLPSRLSITTCLMKMYTSKEILDYVVKNSGDKKMSILWKNLRYNQKI